MNQRSEISNDDLLACAVSAAKTAGNHAMKNMSRRNRVARRYLHDVKLELDIECQIRAEKTIEDTFPDHAILGEEDEEVGIVRGHGSEYEWIIDPIDGTVNFSHGLPFWCCSVAVRKNERVLAGAVYSPGLGELFTARAGGPALCNGVPVRVSRIRAVSDSMVFTGLDKNIDRGIPPYAMFERISGSVQRARIMGCAALDICRVASGRAEAYFESGIYIWDVAAAGLIVQRAGGRVETLAAGEGHRLSFLATNGRVHAALKRLLSIPSR